MYEVQVVRLPEDPVLEPSAEALEVPVVDVEQMTLHPHQDFAKKKKPNLTQILIAEGLPKAAREPFPSGMTGKAT